MFKKIIDGKKISGQIKDELKNLIEKENIKPSMVVISVGDNEASKVYVAQKEKAANYVGYSYKHIHFDSISDDDLIYEIEKINKDKNINGVIVQLPLPKGMDETRIVNSINPDKDIDGLTVVNAGRLINKQKGLVSCTPNGIMELLKRENIDVEGKNAVVIGRSILVGKPMANLLLNANSTVTVCHSKTKDIKSITKKADIIIVAIGKKHFLTEDMIKKGSIVIDVGINRENGKLYGDCDIDKCLPKVKRITPVPGGVGPMTVAMLMKNTYDAYKLQNK